MPDLDLEPGDYRDRKPKGWRWRLPWSHPGDTKLPMVMFFVCVAGGAYLYARRGETTDVGLMFLVGCLVGFCAGGMFMLWLGRDD